MKPLHSDNLGWSGHFYGSGLDLEHYEVLMVQYVPAKDRKIETQLMASKWFDYRLMHPMEATYYFFHKYKEAYRNFYRKAINFEAAQFVKPIKERDFLLSREAMSFWRLRQAVDALGMRYEFFLNYAFDQKRILANGRPLPPRPAQLKTEEILTNAYLAWEDLCKGSLQIACSPIFTAAQYTHAAMQVAYEDFIVAQIKQRRVPQYALSTCLYLYDAIRIERALLEFDEQTVRMAIDHVMA